jgi:hypothetical protein
MVNTEYLSNTTEESSKTLEAAWTLFVDESLDTTLRVAILQKVLKIRIGKLMLSNNLRQYEIQVSNYTDCLICGKAAFNELTERLNNDS